MKFHWVGMNPEDRNAKKLCIELEYDLQTKITKFLMKRLEHECQGDFSAFEFDVDPKQARIAIAENTPSIWAEAIREDFEKRINISFFKEHPKLGRFKNESSRSLYPRSA